ncbi:MAG: hypothetical protein HY744_15690 [Deltaproteobacteria bacterium]|nr:hypothetical protein [Deltaproteobacteria bacterium]
MSEGREASYDRFTCPHCDAELNPGRGPIIQMRGELEAPCFSVTTDVFVSSGLGVYEGLTATGVVLREGAKIEFSCPQCGASFSQSGQDELAQVRMRDSAGRAFLVSFNKRFGKRSTFVIDPDKRQVERQFGDDAASYRADLDKALNFFGS